MTEPTSVPGARLEYSRMPGHWLLARMGKRVLRPGGLELTRHMLYGLSIRESDDVVELAPGLGVTARAALEREPRSYIGIERDEDAAGHVRRYLVGENRRCVVGRAEETGLPDASATVVYGEAMLTMQTAAQKAAIVGEAARVLRAGGRYGIHELSLEPDDLDDAVKSEIQQALSDAIHERVARAARGAGVHRRDPGRRPDAPARARALRPGRGLAADPPLPVERGQDARGAPAHRCDAHHLPTLRRAPRRHRDRRREAATRPSR